MTGFTQLGGGNMRGALAGGRSAIVTTAAGVYHADVTEGGTRPAHGRVTHITRLNRWNMGGGFTGGHDAIVTRLTRAQHFSMIHGHYRCKDIGGVAGLADIRSTNMRRILANGYRAVMTA